MKLGIQTSSLDKQGYGRWGDQTYRKLKEHGYSCSDFSMADTDTVLYTASLEEADIILLHEKALAEEAGIRIWQVHGPWRWPAADTTEEDRAERMEKMKYSIRAAALLGSKNWVIHPIMPYGVMEADTEEAQLTWDMNLAFMKELLKTAKAYDVTICLENLPMPHFSLSTPEKILELANTIDDDHFQICLDTGHVSVFRELDLATEVFRLGSKIRVLHVHDNTRWMDLHLMPFFGRLDWKAFADALKSIDFDGCFSLETMPSRKLPDGIYENMCHDLVQIAKHITADL